MFPGTAAETREERAGMRQGGGENSEADAKGASICCDTEPKRVKVYVLENNEWKDTGTGFCTGEIEELRKDEPSGESEAGEGESGSGGEPSAETGKCAFLVVNNEECPAETLLRSKLEGNIEYQRQEETLIVWKDVDGHDIALSFEESVGCDTLCGFIVQVQRHVANNISLVAVRASNNGTGSVHEIIAGPVSLPSVEKEQDTATLMESLKALNENTAYEYLKNETIEFLLQSSYIDLLINLFNKAEENKQLKVLLLLSSIVKTLILYSNRDILELMVDDSHVMGIIGILEYDTEFPTMKANHRHYLMTSGPIFKEVLPLKNAELKELVKKCFRLQFLKDVVLVRFLDDHNLNLIMDILLDLETCIMSFLQRDSFLDRIMALYNPENVKENAELDDLAEKKKDGIKLLHQCVQMSKNLDPMEKTNFYKALVTKGLFNVLYYAFKMETDSNTRILATDMIIAIIEHDLLLIQNVQHEKLSQEDDAVDMKNDKLASSGNSSGEETEDMKLLAVLTTILLTDKSPGLRGQVVQALTTLLHPDGCLEGAERGYDNSHMLNKFNFGMGPDDDPGFATPADYKSDVTNPDLTDLQLKRYFSNFYEQIAPILFSPLIDMKNGATTTTANTDEQLLIHLVKMVSFICTEHNRMMSRTFILEKGILKSVSKLMEMNHIPQLRLTALRTFKNIMCLNDNYYHRYMISSDVYDPIFILLEENIKKDNLTVSCIQDFCKIISNHCIPTLGLDNNSPSPIKRSTNQIKKSNFVILNKYLVNRFFKVFSGYKDVLFLKDLLDVDERLSNLENNKNSSNTNGLPPFNDEEDTVNMEDISMDSTDHEANAGQNKRRRSAEYDSFTAEMT
ncbi:Psy2p KNAG_0F01090 [Huiozyma naganishii CBS 8797]|uniref:Serine/threonine-protein phosphatase 4 regulatory subunit 3 n=1 Tax=Huiozyma naganishii (strain ATCC MYA-139 / BCRC 22969 / CBS 8797 / KCTC 17520 / NBRC 10181 / NCYC 3082 / Yp74L-3) TaxID=1071383 RepID=J7RZV2_HUIN7|nr:hypothetical protein KNAG_0F01090 [Kazachstania naganishii CBS 8797]CCK70777.1 hypothetical protein KNAG_0F01090 [Kazachstania naganishii CBS 8797]